MYPWPHQRQWTKYMVVRSPRVTVNISLVIPIIKTWCSYVARASQYKDLGDAMEMSALLLWVMLGHGTVG